MIVEPVSQTAMLTAAARAAERGRTHPLFDDPFAELLAGRQGHDLLMRVGLDVAVPSIAIRTRYFDDVVRAARTARGVTQFVLLGAGLDTRAYRMHLPSSGWYEVDWPPVLAYKRGLLEQTGARPTVGLRHVAMDVLDDALFPELAATGLDWRRPILWVAEGLFAFLEQHSVEKLLVAIARHSCAGSEILFDVPNAACGRGEGDIATAAEVLRSCGFRFATDAPMSLAQRLGFRTMMVHERHPLVHHERRGGPPMETLPTGQWATYYVHGVLPTNRIGQKATL